eukprot:1899295-Pyramimonas_sp.AAC.1
MATEMTAEIPSVGGMMLTQDALEGLRGFLGEKRRRASSGTVTLEYCSLKAFISVTLTPKNTTTHEAGVRGGQHRAE